jgi:hypothetical protein
MRKMSLLASLVAILALLASSAMAVPAPAADQDNTVLAGDEGGGGGGAKNKPKGERVYMGGGRPDKPKGPPKAKPEYGKPWNEVTKDFEKSEGLFDVYTKDEEVLFTVKKDQLDKPYVMFMNLSKGLGARFVLGGLPISGSIMFDFHQTTESVQVRQLNTLFRAPEDEALQEAIDLSYGNSILFNLPIASEKDGDLLVDMSKAFLSDIGDMGYWLTLVLQKPVRQDPKKGFFYKVKTFPENVEVDVRLTYSPGDRRGLNLPTVPDSRYIELGVNYSVQKLPEVPMKPRLADDRVGYFMTPHKDFSLDENENFFVHYINRWRLEKKDPSAAVSDPVTPITFYVDTTVPEKYRDAVARGIEMWQPAFEKAGFSNAIIAGDPADVEDYDAEDARYNTIRWIASDQPSFGAIGPSRTDPRTGEIIDSDVLMEQNLVMSRRKAYRRYAGPDAMIRAIDPTMKFLQDPAEDPELSAELELLQKIGQANALCTIGAGLENGMDFMGLALMLDGLSLDDGDYDKYIMDAIAYVTAHEVGHAIGLRHNFESSISTPYDKLNDKTTIKQIGMTGSVMDYSAPNVSRDRSKQGYYYSPSVGTYDHWAIEFGYKALDGDKSVKEEAAVLKPIADLAGEKRHAYGTDEDTYPAGALDPNPAIWDLSDNPLAWAKERMGVCKDILGNGTLVDRVVEDEENYTALRNAVETVLIQEYIAASRAVRYVGGQYTARPHKGDNSGDMPLMPVSAAEQRDAMGFIAENAFSAGAFTLAPEILNQLQDNKLWDWQNNLFSYGRRYDFPMTGWVAAFQNAIITQLLHPMRLQRMVDAEYKQSDPYKCSEMYRTLTGTIWTNNIVPSGRTAMMQRNLQRIYLHHLIQMTVSPAPGTPWESIALSRLHLQRLRGQINGAFQRSGLSDEANAHLAESLARIDRALDAKLESSY